MDKKDLLKSIEEDKKLKALSKDLMEAEEHAKNLIKKVEKRQSQLLRKYNNYYNETEPPNTSDIYEVEKAVENMETREQIARKYIALEKVKKRSWTNDKRYREVKAQYYRYIIPILTDLESAKQKKREKIAEINKRYNKELAEAKNEFKAYEDKVKELITVAGEISNYVYQVGWVENKGGIAKSDDFARSRAEFYSKSTEFNDVTNSLSHWGPYIY